MKQNLLLAIIVCLFFSCNPTSNRQTENKASQPIVSNLPYNLDLPENKYILPDKLNEISGLSFYKDNQLVCVNDEDGKIFFYDFEKEKVVNQSKFGKKDDYEGIEVVGNEIFVLKSNGKIFGLDDDENETRNLDCKSSEVIEYEGLGYDSKTNKLLLVAKERIKTMDEDKMIYAYDLTNDTFGQHIKIPKSFIASDGKSMMPSGIAVHPQTGQIYVLASSGKKLLILSNQGEKEELISLDESVFTQPEGICFSPNGDLFISSEGKKNDGYILRFRKTDNL